MTTLLHVILYMLAGIGALTVFDAIVIGVLVGASVHYDHKRNKQLDRELAQIVGEHG